jgi:CDP-diacylglycerol--glycerol-3-phosphate 3-phosphatidyltransferase
MVKLDKFRQSTANHISQPAAHLLSKTPVTPNALTWFGFWLTVGAAILIANGYLLVSGFIVLFAGLFDMLDGALARLTKKSTRFGAVLDSTLDRLGEAALLLGLLALYVQDRSTPEVLLVALVILGSFMVSYLRARTEALGLEGKVGIFTRPERVIVLALGLLLSQIDYALTAALAIIAVLSFFTAGQRLFYVWHQTRAS